MSLSNVKPVLEQAESVVAKIAEPPLIVRCIHMDVSKPYDEFPHRHLTDAISDAWAKSADPRHKYMYCQVLDNGMTLIASFNMLWHYIEWENEYIRD